MMYTSDITSVIKHWKERLHSTNNDSSYKIALSECISELEDTINGNMEQQLNDNYYS